MNSNGKKNYNTYFLVILGLMFLAAWMFRGLNGQETDYTHGMLTKDLEEGDIIGAVIQPNKETPTGVVRVFCMPRTYRKWKMNWRFTGWTRRYGISQGKTGL